MLLNKYFERKKLIRSIYEQLQYSNSQIAFQLVENKYDILTVKDLSKIIHKSKHLIFFKYRLFLFLLKNFSILKLQPSDIIILIRKIKKCPTLNWDKVVQNIELISKSEYFQNSDHKIKKILLSLIDDSCMKHNTYKTIVKNNLRSIKKELLRCNNEGNFKLLALLLKEIPTKKFKSRYLNKTLYKIYYATSKTHANSGKDLRYIWGTILERKAIH